MNWDEYFMSLAYQIAFKSKDASTKVGCVIVGPDNEIRTTGYNSFPRGINDDVPERQERPEKYKWIEHSERNAIYNAARVGIPLKGCRIYLPWIPCTDCARAIINVGITKIIVDDRPNNPWKSPERMSRWKDDMNRSLKMLSEAGVEIQYWGTDK
mgnify:CR=1 FL=1